MDQDVLKWRTIWWQREGHRHIWEYTFHFTLSLERQKQKKRSSMKEKNEKCKNKRGHCLLSFPPGSYFACHGAVNIPQVLSAPLTILHGAHRFFERHVHHRPAAVEPRLPERLLLAPSGSGHRGCGRCPRNRHIQRRAKWTNLQEQRWKHGQARGQPLVIRLPPRAKEKSLQTCQER